MPREAKNKRIAVIRTWAKEQGYDVANVGHLSPDIVIAYEVATGDYAPAPASSATQEQGTPQVDAEEKVDEALLERILDMQEGDTARVQYTVAFDNLQQLVTTEAVIYMIDDIPCFMGFYMLENGKPADCITDAHVTIPAPPRFQPQQRGLLQGTVAIGPLPATQDREAGYYSVWLPALDKFFEIHQDQLIDAPLEESDFTGFDA